MPANAIPNAIPNPFSFSLSALPHSPLGKAVAGTLDRPLKKLLGINKVQGLLHDLRANPAATAFPDAALRKLDISVQTSEQIESIPAMGPLVVVANHPFGIIDGLILLDRVSRVRPDVKIMSNFLLAGLDEICEQVIAVDPYDRPEATRFNLSAMRSALRWLKEGGALIIFPAGAVSGPYDPASGAIVDPPWQHHAARLARLAKAPVLPMFFHGQNDFLFQAAARVHPRIRTFLIAKALLAKQGQEIRLETGNLIPARKIQRLTEGDKREADNRLTDYLRFRCHLLARRERPGISCNVRACRQVPRRTLSPIIPPVSPDDLEADICALPPSACLVERGDLRVYVARANQIPHVLREIGRLREVTFRRAGEGTGKACDVDAFDQTYHHLFIYQHAKRDLVGAYRLARTREILPYCDKGGAKGLYSNRLFRYRPSFFEQTGPAIELGRSFVQPAYQKSFSPLLLLWQGIARFVAQEPAAATLFGAVSISNDFTHTSRQLIAEHLRLHHWDETLAGCVRPATPFRATDLGAAAPGRHDTSMAEVSSWTADLETDGRPVPVLVKQYIELGGRIAGFNVDPEFGHTLDGLVVINFDEVSDKHLKRYLGEDGLRLFREARRSM